MLKGKKAVRKTASKPKRATTKPKASKPRQRAVQTPRMAEPKVLMIEEPKVTAKKTATKSKAKSKAKTKAATKSKAVAKSKAKSKAKLNTVYEVAYPQSLPAPKTTYKGKVLERRTKTAKIEAPRQDTVIVKETVMIEPPKEKVKKDRQLAKRALAGAVLVGASTKQATKVLAQATKERKAQRQLARREKTTVYAVDYPQSLPAPKQDVLPARETPQLPPPKTSTVRQMETCEGKGYLARKACQARNRKIARDY